MAGKKSTRTPEERKQARKEATKRWRERNPEKVKERRKRQFKNNPETTKGRWNRRRESNTQNLTDNYLRAMLAQGTGLERSVFPEEFVDLVRAQITLKRLIKQLKSQPDDPWVSTTTASVIERQPSAQP